MDATLSPLLFPPCACLEALPLCGPARSHGAVARSLPRNREQGELMGINVPYRGPADLPETLRVFPLAGALLLPRGHMPLNVFEPRYLALIDDALRTDRLIGMIQPDEESTD